MNFFRLPNPAITSISDVNFGLIDVLNKLSQDILIDLVAEELGSGRVC